MGYDKDIHIHSLNLRTIMRMVSQSILVDEVSIFLRAVGKKNRKMKMAYDNTISSQIEEESYDE